MNAPIHAALLAARACLPAAAPRIQPTIPADLLLLKTGYEHGDLYLNLHGLLDSSGYDVQAVSLTGVTHNGAPVCVTDMTSPGQLQEMSDWCDRKLPSARELGLISQAESRAEHAMWERLNI